MSAPDDKNLPLGADLPREEVLRLYERCHAFYQEFMKNVNIPYSTWSPADLEHIVDQTFDEYDGVNFTFMDAILYSMSHVGGLHRDPRLEYIPFSVIILLQMFAFRAAFPREFLDDKALSESEGIRNCIRYFYKTIFNAQGRDFIFKFGYSTHTTRAGGHHAMAILGRYDDAVDMMRLIIFDPHGQIEYHNILPVAEFISLIAHNAPTDRFSLYTLNSKAGYQGNAGVCSWITHDFITTILLTTTYDQRSAWFDSCTTLCTLEVNPDPPGIQYIDASWEDYNKSDSSIFTEYFNKWYSDMRGPSPTPAEYPVRRHLLLEIRWFLNTRMGEKKNRYQLKKQIPSSSSSSKKIEKLTETDNKDLDHMFYVASLLETIFTGVIQEKPDSSKHSAPIDRRILVLSGIKFPKPLTLFIRSFISDLDSKKKNLRRAHDILFKQILPNLKNIRVNYPPEQEVISIRELENEEKEEEEKRRKEIELEQRRIEMEEAMQARRQERKQKEEEASRKHREKLEKMSPEERERYLEFARKIRERFAPPRKKKE